MAALLNMPKATWKRQPHGVCRFNYSNNIVPHIYAGVSFAAGQELLLNCSRITATLPERIKGNDYWGGQVSAVPLTTAIEYKFDTPVDSENDDWAILAIAKRGRTITSNRSIAGIYAGSSNLATRVMAIQEDNDDFILAVTAGSQTSEGALGVIPGDLFLPIAGVYRQGVGVSLRVKNYGSTFVSGTYTGLYGSINTVYGFQIGEPDASSGWVSEAYFIKNKIVDALLDDYVNNPYQVYALSPSRFYLIPSAGGVLSLIVANATQSHFSDAPSLTQAHVLTLADSLHSQSVESPFLSQAYALTLAAAAHAHAADSTTLIQSNVVETQEALHSQGVESITLTQAHVLNLSEALHSQTAEGITLSAAGVLTVAESVHNQTSDNLGLTQAHLLTIAEALHSQSADALVLTQAYVLSLTDTAHNQTADGITLSTALNLSVAESLHSQTTDTFALTQSNVLAIQDALHDQTADVVNLGQGYSLLIADSLHSQSTDAPTLSVAFVLSVLDSLHSQFSDGLGLITDVTLVVSDALHSQLAGSASELTLPTGERIFLVAVEDRLFLVAAEDRNFGV